MNIFISGGNGYIGSALATKLAEQGHKVHAIVRSPEKSVLKSVPGITLFRGDIMDAGSVQEAMRGCRQVYHLAAFAKIWSPSDADYFNVNVTGTRHVLDAAIKEGVQKVVLTSTAGIYGPSIDGIIDENKVRPVDFFSLYESSKALSESLAKDYINRHQLDMVIVSPSRVYGPSPEKNLSSINLMVDRYIRGKWRIMPGSGDKIGNYVHMDDVVNGHLAAMERGLSGHTYILGGINADYIDFFKILSDISGVKKSLFKLPVPLIRVFAGYQEFMAENFKREPLITPSWVAKAEYDFEINPAKMVEGLGIQPIGLEQGLEDTIHWLRSIQ